jgi:hypothetical protein
MKTDTAPATRWLCLAATTSVILALAGCSAIGAKPWDRDLLAKRAMQLNTHPNVTAFQEHVEFSKEASAGGRSFDGGGCGCN